jgi:hypothetical protein
MNIKFDQLNVINRMKTWNVLNNSTGQDLGQVHETSEEFARCAALSKFGEEGERAALRANHRPESKHAIYEDDDFSVFEAR